MRLVRIGNVVVDPEQVVAVFPYRDDGGPPANLLLKGYPEAFIVPVSVDEFMLALAEAREAELSAAVKMARDLP